MVVMAMRVLPDPRWAALITREMMLNIMPPMMMRKYSTAPSWVSAPEPHRRIMGSARYTQTALTTVPAMAVNTRAVSRVSLAP